MQTNRPPVFRFAPSPNGALHLGHAYSALINQRMARKTNGQLLLRIEDIDRQRCSRELEKNMLDDLSWLGIEWDEVPRRQSEHFADYSKALNLLRNRGLIYPAFMSRSDIRKTVAGHNNWPLDPDGTPHYPGDERTWSLDRQQAKQHEIPLHSLRLNMAAALQNLDRPLHWLESGRGPDGETGEQIADPAQWGDVVLARSDTPTSYHLSVVVDDAFQGITDVVRGQDLFHATSIQRLLQFLLKLPAPRYHHHDLILEEKGQKLSKSKGDTSLRTLREAGLSPVEVRKMVGF